jgi:hypothetical protein
VILHMFTLFENQEVPPFYIVPKKIKDNGDVVVENTRFIPVLQFVEDGITLYQAENQPWLNLCRYKMLTLPVLAFQTEKQDKREITVDNTVCVVLHQDPVLTVMGEQASSVLSPFDGIKIGAADIKLPRKCTHIEDNDTASNTLHEEEQKEEVAKSGAEEENSEDKNNGEATSDIEIKEIDNRFFYPEQDDSIDSIL